MSCVYGTDTLYRDKSEKYSQEINEARLHIQKLNFKLNTTENQRNELDQKVSELTRENELLKKENESLKKDLKINNHIKALEGEICNDEKWNELLDKERRITDKLLDEIVDLQLNYSQSAELLTRTIDENKYLKKQIESPMIPAEDKSDKAPPSEGEPKPQTQPPAKLYFFVKGDEKPASKVMENEEKRRKEEQKQNLRKLQEAAYKQRQIQTWNELNQKIMANEKLKKALDNVKIANKLKVYSNH